MKKCLDCSCDISDRGSRAIRCDICQIKHRKEYNKQFADIRKPKVEQSNKRLGSSRYNKTTYQWSKELMRLTSDDLMQLVTVYKERIKYAQNDEDKKELRTRVKIITQRYEQLQPDRGSPKSNVYGKDSICEDCRFYNKRQLKCTLHNEDEMDKAIETNICSDYEYDKEAKYRKEYYKQDIDRINESDDLGDYDYYQYEECDE